MPAPKFSLNHIWYAAANVPVPPESAEQALENGYLVLPAEVRIDVLDLRCSQCQQWYDAARGSECAAATAGTAHLRGGPINVRRKRKCPLHHVAWDDCEHLHDEPTNYGRPPMPAEAFV